MSNLDLRVVLTNHAKLNREQLAKGEARSPLPKEIVDELRAVVQRGERANLAGANLAGAYLARADLAGANLADAYLADANLAGANLAGAYLAGANLARANLADAYLARANLARANLARAYLARAYLADADLAGANLAVANLAGANLADAYLADAYLADADLAGAYLADADLAGANLAGANLARAKGISRPAVAETPEEAEKRRADWLARRAANDAERARRYRERNPEVPVVEQLDAKILAAVTTGGGRLDMGNWHTCETTHCRAGWAIHLAGAAGYELENKLGDPLRAGRAIYRASTGRVPHFFATTENALADIRACAERDGGAA